MSKPLDIKVMGLGGAGCNIVSRLPKNNFSRTGFFVANTDAQSLNQVRAVNKILLGEKITGGIGAGMNVPLGEKAAIESEEKIKKSLEGAEIVFLVAGMGGGSGTPGISVAAKKAKELGILTIAIVTMPFSFEGAARKKIARKGLLSLKENCDAYLIIENDKILEVSSNEVSLERAFSMVDECLVKAMEGIQNLLVSSGIISVDFADLEEVIKNSGRAFMGIGRAQGEQRALSAASRVFQSSLLGDAPQKAKGILFNVGGRGVTLSEINQVAGYIKKMANQKTKIIFGVSENGKTEKGELEVTLIATGIE